MKHCLRYLLYEGMVKSKGKYFVLVSLDINGIGRFSLRFSLATKASFVYVLGLNHCRSVKVPFCASNIFVFSPCASRMIYFT